MKTYIFTCKFPNGYVHSYTYTANNTEEAMRFANLDMKGDKSTFISLMRADMVDIVEELNNLDRPMDERKTVYKICEFMRDAKRETAHIDALQELAVSLQMNLAMLHHYLIKIHQSMAYRGLISYTFAVDLRSLYVRPEQH